MAKGASRLGHAELKEKKYMELLARQLGIIDSLVASLDAVTGNRRPEDTIDAKSEATRGPSENCSLQNESIANDGAKTSPTGNQEKNVSIAKSDVTNDSIGKAHSRKRVRKIVFDIFLAAVWAYIFALYAESIRMTFQFLFWKGIEFVGFPVTEILRVLATFWIL